MFEEFKHFFQESYEDRDNTSGTISDRDDDIQYDPSDCYCESTTSLEDVDLTNIDHLYFWSPVRFISDNASQEESISIENEGRLFVTDKMGLCPFYTLYDSDIFKDITEKYNADIIPILPRDLDTLDEEENITVKLLSPEAVDESGEFNLYVYEVDKDSINNIKYDTQYKNENLYLIPKSNGDIRIYPTPVKESHIKYQIIAENGSPNNVFESGSFAKYAEGVDLSKARGPIESETKRFYGELKKALGQNQGVVQEAKLSTKKRNKLDDSDFALVYTDRDGKKIRKYPIHDEAHVRAAAKMFPRGIPMKYCAQVARKILRRAHEFNIDTSGWNSINNYKERD